MKKIIFIFIGALLLSCHGKQEYAFVVQGQKYAQGFSIEKKDEYTLVHIHYPEGKEILQSYILIPKTQDIPSELPEGVIVRTPLERV
ncbi:ABC transporter substrate-binding protein, partial [Bacteroidales bacterium OttesenSCG-928-M11]|nr:ABC transporter substrate-binding protein [Bacteroidales bacterium OttesenSCG-928-M11]